MHQWLQTPTGRYLLAWEQAQVDAAVADIFGYHALQLGIPELAGLQNNRMPHRWLAVEGANGEAGADTGSCAADIQFNFAALPFSANSLDLLVMPHTLEASMDAHATLREVERVLVPEGKVVIVGFNPLSLWGVQQVRSRIYRKLGLEHHFLPEAELISYWRLRDWLRLLDFEVVAAEFGCYRPGVASEKWLQRWAWMDAVGSRWWPILGSVYTVVAVKKVRGMRLMGKAWKTSPVGVGQVASVAQKEQKDSRCG